MRVKFKVDRTTKEAAPQTFKAGETYNLSEHSARHWINRGVAEEVTDESHKGKGRAEVMVPSPPAKGESL